MHNGALYSRSDGVIPWRNCMDPEAARNFEVGGTHIGLAFNPRVYRIVASLLAEVGAERPRAACTPAA